MSTVTAPSLNAPTMQRNESRTTSYRGTAILVGLLFLIATAAFRMFRPAHSALLPGLCSTPLELSSANVVRGLLDSVSTLLGPLAAALLLDLSSAAAVFVTSAVLSFASAMLLLRLSYEAPQRGRQQPLRRILHESRYRRWSRSA